MANNSSVFDSIDVIGDSVFTGSITVIGDSVFAGSITTNSDVYVSGTITGSASFNVASKVTYLSTNGLSTLTNISTPSLFDLMNGNLNVYPFGNAQLRFGFAGNNGFFPNFRCDVFNSGTTLGSASGNTRTVQLQATPPNDGGANYYCTAYGYNGTTFVYTYSSQAPGLTWTPAFYLKPGARATILMDYTNRHIVFQADGVQTTA